VGLTTLGVACAKAGLDAAVAAKATMIANALMTASPKFVLTTWVGTFSAIVEKSPGIQLCRGSGRGSSTLYEGTQCWVV
jgi:hypothetical protein